jgi:hypothetical protein
MILKSVIKTQFGLSNIKRSSCMCVDCLRNSKPENNINRRDDEKSSTFRVRIK